MGSVGDGSGLKVWCGGTMKTLVSVPRVGLHAWLGPDTIVKVEAEPARMVVLVRVVVVRVAVVLELLLLLLL